VGIIPVASERSAIFQSMLAGRRHEVSSLLLTASGGPFRTVTIEQMRIASRAQALAHPNWSMGVKNTVDSATAIGTSLCSTIVTRVLVGMQVPCRSRTLL
jgi:1-deoxy-D-xylulose-5-phosphate reductoisomerase